MGGDEIPIDTAVGFMAVTPWCKDDDGSKI